MTRTQTKAQDERPPATRCSASGAACDTKRRRAGPAFPRLRNSRSAQQSFDAEMKRLRGLTLEARILEALGMTERYSWIETTTESDRR